MVLSFSLEGDFVEKLVIVGGGVAGLSCLNALLDRGISPLLLEGATVGTPKMCGEFLAPQAVNLLKKWDIGPLQEIHHVDFFSREKKLNFSFSKPAGAVSRSAVELLLAQHAQKRGGRIQENVFIKKISAGTAEVPYIFSLASGEELEVDTVIFATGKLGQTNSPGMSLPYFGIKFHFPRVVKSNSLLMYSQKEAYLGIVPISADVSNCACLVKRESVERFGTGKDFFRQLLATTPILRENFQNLDLAKLAWFESRAPEFELRHLPQWPRAFWIGDALAGLYPAIGSGFSHAISSAQKVVDFYLQNNPRAYVHSVKQDLKPKLFLGRLMHKIMLNPFLASLVFSLLKLNPWLLNRCLKVLGYKD